jgi:hypothetical protein
LKRRLVVAVVVVVAVAAVFLRVVAGVLLSF